MVLSYQLRAVPLLLCLAVMIAAVIDEEKLKYERVKKKGYVRIVTNMGPLNVELHCDLVPKTCENFLVHCQRGYYNNTKFHRSIKNFMVRLFALYSGICYFFIICYRREFQLH